MLQFYPQIRAVHVTAVVASGIIFLVRGIAVQARAAWPLAAPIRYVSYVVDTVLLAAGVTLVVVLPGAMFANGWLAVKLILVAAYIVIGTFALKRAHTMRRKLLFFIAALCTYAIIITVAWTHSPLGPLVWLLR